MNKRHYFLSLLLVTQTGCVAEMFAGITVELPARSTVEGIAGGREEEESAAEYVERNYAAIREDVAEGERNGSAVGNAMFKLGVLEQPKRKRFFKRLRKKIDYYFPKDKALGAKRITRWANKVLEKRS